VRPACGSTPGPRAVTSAYGLAARSSRLRTSTSAEYRAAAPSGSLRARRVHPASQRRRLDFAFRVSHQLIDRPLWTLDQPRPLQQRGSGTHGQRFREIARELWLALRERHACSSLHQFRRQTLARSQPVEYGFTGIGKAARRQPLLDDRLLETLVAIERGPGSEGMAAKRDVGVRVIVIMLEVGLPLPARTEIREPCASQAARVWRRAVLVQVAGDRCVCAEILRESRDLEVGVEGIGAERVIVGRRRSRTARLRRRIGHPESGANGRVLVGVRARGRREREDHQCADPSGHWPECTCAAGSDFQDAVSGQLIAGRGCRDARGMCASWAWPRAFR
jgi:hypothetical protein